MMEKVSLRKELSLISETWHPRVVAELNGQQVKLAKISGEFVWHCHEHQDEFFLVLDGAMTIRLRDREVQLTKGDCFVVPRGVEHQPTSEGETHILLFEPAGTINTGNVRNELTRDHLDYG